MKGEAMLGEYKLAYDFNALCKAEEELGPMGKAMARIEEGSLSTVRALVWAGLQKHHPMTIEQAGEAVEAVGFDKASEAISKAMSAAFPDQSKAGNVKAGKKPA